MATIPLGNFGNAVARPAPLPSLPRGNPVGQAAERLAGDAAQIVNDMAAQETRQRQQALAEQQHEEKQARAAALHAKAMTTVAGGRDALADLHDEISQGIADGSVPKEKAEAEFSKRAAKALDGLGADLPEDKRASILADLNGAAARLGNGVRKAVTQRDRQDVTSGITQSLEYLQRQYKADPSKATQQAMQTIDQLGPHSTLTPDALAKLRQSWKEGTQYTAAYEMVTAGRSDRRALDAAERSIGNLPDLDPQKRATLLDRTAAYRLHLDQKAEMAAARAEREAERRLKKAEAEFNTFQGLADKGTLLDPQYIDRAVTATTGTPYQAGIVALAQQAKEAGGLAAAPVRVQQATLDQVNTLIAQRGRTPELDKRKDQIEKVLRGSLGDLDRDGLRAGLERGVITEIKPLDLSAGLQSVGPQLAERVTAAERVSVWAGRPVSPLTSEEAATFQRQLQALPAKERATTLAGLAVAIGPQQAQGLALQIDKQDKGLALALASAADKTTEGRFTSELILKGQQAKADGTSTKGEKQPEVKAGSWRAHAAAELDGVFPNAQIGAQVRDAAEMIMHGMAAEAGGRLTRDDMDRAVRLAIGGTLVEHNGRKIPLPAGVDEDALRQRLSAVTVADLASQLVQPAAAGGAPPHQAETVVRVAGVNVSAAEFVKTLPGQQLMPVKPGQYAVIVGGRPVTNAAGKPIVIGVR